MSPFGEGWPFGNTEMEDHQKMTSSQEYTLRRFFWSDIAQGLDLEELRIYIAVLYFAALIRFEQEYGETLVEYAERTLPPDQLAKFEASINAPRKPFDPERVGAWVAMARFEEKHGEPLVEHARRRWGTDQAAKLEAMAGWPSQETPDPERDAVTDTGALTRFYWWAYKNRDPMQIAKARVIDAIARTVAVLSADERAEILTLIAKANSAGSRGSARRQAKHVVSRLREIVADNFRGSLAGASVSPSRVAAFENLVLAGAAPPAPPPRRAF